MNGLARAAFAAAVATAAGAAVWTWLVPTSGSMGGWYVPVMCASGFVIALGAATSSALIAAALIAPQVVSVVANPRGDNDGLQLLWYPVFGFMFLVLLFASEGGRGIRRRLTRRRVES